MINVSFYETYDHFTIRVYDELLSYLLSIDNFNKNII